MDPTQPADRIFEGGTLLTMNERQPSAQAVALQGGRILAVGTRHEVFAFQGPDTEVVSMRGGTMIPAVVDDDTAPENVEQEPQGTLEPGQRANFVVLNGNPLTVTPRAREELRVMHVVKDGQSLYMADTEAAHEDAPVFSEDLFLDESGWLV
ncbi:amidohydrolase family protein [Myxococcus stipitatus]|uniref:amidohydrolase family protein n=1 Tax=Myxococcus stipitatus TaxID=83455 RepID=UPI0031453645